MSRRIIDMSKDPRCAQFEYFRQMTDPWAGVTVQVDVTDFLGAIDGEPFFLNFLFAVMRAANAVPELRRRILPDGGVVEYDRCNPSYTVMKPDGVYVYCLVESDLSSRTDFVALGKRRQQEVIDRGTLTEDGDSLEHFFVSCVPWLHYSQIRLPSGLPGECNPRFAWGQYQEQGGRKVMPVSLFIHHGLADGWHISQFFENLRRELAAISEEKNKIEI